MLKNILKTAHQDRKWKQIQYHFDKVMTATKRTWRLNIIRFFRLLLLRSCCPLGKRGGSTSVTEHLISPDLTWDFFLEGNEKKKVAKTWQDSDFLTVWFIIISPSPGDTWNHFGSSYDHFTWSIDEGKMSRTSDPLQGTHKHRDSARPKTTSPDSVPVLSFPSLLFSNF